MNYTYFLLVLVRMGGCIFFNPIFGRKNLPAMYKTGLSLLLTFTVMGLLPQKNIVIGSFIVLIVTVFKELLIGFLISYIMSLFLGVVATGGELIDMQIGLSMSQLYDPSSNISMGLTATFLNIMTMLIFFLVGGHINLIQIFITSCKLISVGGFTLTNDFLITLVDMFSNMLILVIKLAMPILAVEIILEAGIGILMKAIPQIQVFSVNIQLKIIVGFTLVIVLVPTFASFIDKLMTIMFETMRHSLSAIIG